MTEPMELLQQIEEFERLREAATPGVWVIAAHESIAPLGYSLLCKMNGQDVYAVRPDETVVGCDQKLIVHAANNLPTFLTAVRERLDRDAKEQTLLNAELTQTREIAKNAIAQRDRFEKAYYDIADAICAESVSVSDLCSKARNTRECLQTSNRRVEQLESQLAKLNRVVEAAKDFYYGRTESRQFELIVGPLLKELEIKEST